MIGLGVFAIWPVFQNAYFSLTTWGAFGGHTFTGLTNYEQLFSDPEVFGTLRNTVVYAVLVVVISVPLGIIVSALLTRPNLRAVSIYRTIYFLPVVTLPAAVALMWQYVYNGDYGPINQFLRLFGVHGLAWAADPRTALYAVVVVSVWSSVGYNMVIFLAGIQGISKQYYEAAAIDGAGPFRQFLSVTVPLLSPSIFFVTVISVINAFQVFDLIFLMIGRTNPALPNSETIVYLFYEQAFFNHNGGYAAAIAFLLFAMILVVTALQFGLQRRWVHYD